MTQDIGVLRKTSGRYEFVYEDLSLVIRGPYVEWVMEAAAEVVADAERIRSEGVVEELQMLCEFGESTDVELDSAKYDKKARFEAIPQCLISMGDIDYKWVSKDGRKGEGEKPLERLVDMSLTRNNTFLQDEA